MQMNEIRNTRIEPIGFHYKVRSMYWRYRETNSKSYSSNSRYVSNVILESLLLRKVIFKIFSSFMIPIFICSRTKFEAIFVVVCVWFNAFFALPFWLLDYCVI